MAELSPDHKTMFNVLKQQFIEEVKVREEKQRELEEKEDKAEQERSDRMAEINKSRKEKL
jgi:hypothetical protein